MIFAATLLRSPIAIAEKNPFFHSLKSFPSSLHMKIFISSSFFLYILSNSKNKLSRLERAHTFKNSFLWDDDDDDWEISVTHTCVRDSEDDSRVVREKYKQKKKF